MTGDGPKKAIYFILEENYGMKTGESIHTCMRLQLWLGRGLIITWSSKQAAVPKALRPRIGPVKSHRAQNPIEEGSISDFLPQPLIGRRERVSLSTQTPQLRQAGHFHGFDAN